MATRSPTASQPLVCVRKRTDALAGSCAEIWAGKGIITGNRCVPCGSTRATDSGASFHRFPADKTARARWIANLQLGANAVKPYSRLCSRPSCRFAIHLALAVLSAGKRCKEAPESVARVEAHRTHRFPVMILTTILSQPRSPQLERLFFFSHIIIILRNIARVTYK